MTRPQIIMLIAFVAVWIWAAIGPLYPDDWLLENYLVFLFLPLILLLAHFRGMSNPSFAMILIFMALHVVGSHYTYAEVPFGDTLQRWLDAPRNMYDRLVHFCYGLLLAYPLRELLLRRAIVGKPWDYAAPVVLTMFSSALYEIIEWLVAVRVDPAAGIAFLGAQGDVWDAQKDMALAGLGAVLAMLIAWAVERLAMQRSR